MQKSFVKNIIEQKRVEKSANFKKFLSKPKFLQLQNHSSIFFLYIGKTKYKVEYFRIIESLKRVYFIFNNPLMKFNA